MGCGKVQFGARPEWFEALHNIEVECFPEPWPKPVLDKHLRKNPTWVAMMDRKPVGFIMTSQPNRRTPEIITLDVAKSYRGNGLASKLMEEAEWFFRAKNYKKDRTECGR